MRFPTILPSLGMSIFGPEAVTADIICTVNSIQKSQKNYLAIVVSSMSEAAWVELQFNISSAGHVRLMKCDSYQSAARAVTGFCMKMADTEKLSLQTEFFQSAKAGNMSEAKIRLIAVAGFSRYLQTIQFTKKNALKIMAFVTL